MTHTLTPTAERYLQDDLALWRVHTPHGHAIVAEQGAQLLSYVPTGQPPLVWLSEQARYERGESVRGGVPVCWPWFSDLARNPAQVRAGVDPARHADAPKHGFVRTQDWTHAETAVEGDALTMIFKLDVVAGTSGWGQAAHFTLRLRFAETVTIELGVTNESLEPMIVSQALHTYFAVSDVRQVQVTGLDGARFIDTLDDWQTKTQAGALRFTGETDRLYLDVGNTLTIDDPGWSRQVRIQTSHSGSAVIWNPWIEKASRLSQFADDAWPDMLCIETARVWDNLLTITPGETGYMAVHVQALPNSGVPGEDPAR